MEYRDIKYEYIEWTTRLGDRCNAFSCSDKTLFKGVSDYVMNQTKTLDKMHSMIDYYLDNRAKLIRDREVERVATETFYETLKYKGD
jgi:hypothetical protein